MKKGQVFSGEFIIAYMIFIVVLSMVIYLWNSTTRGVLDSDIQFSLNEKATDAAEQIIRTPGSPNNWYENLSNIYSVGLANESRILLRDKVLSFTELISTSNNSYCEGDPNYECHRNLLGLSNYEFFFNITYMNKSTVMINETMIFGGRPAVNETRKVTIGRTAILENEIVHLYLTVWREE